MDEIKRSVEYSVKRSQALRNMESHLQTILFDSAKSIVNASKRYISGGRLVNESSLLSDAKRITAEAEESIGKYISAYSKASCKILGLENPSSIESFLEGDELHRQPDSLCHPNRLQRPIQDFRSHQGAEEGHQHRHAILRQGILPQCLPKHREERKVRDIVIMGAS